MGHVDLYSQSYMNTPNTVSRKAQLAVEPMQDQDKLDDEKVDSGRITLRSVHLTE